MQFLEISQELSINSEHQYFWCFLYSYLKITGTFASEPILGGGLDLRYIFGSMATVLQFFSSLISSQSF